MTGIHEGILERFQQGSRKPVIEDSKMQIPPIEHEDGSVNFNLLFTNSMSPYDLIIKGNGKELKIPNLFKIEEK